MNVPRRLLATVVSTAVASTALTGCDGPRSADLSGPETTTSRDVPDRSELATEVVDELELVLRRRDAGVVTDLAELPRGSAARLRTLARNARALDLRDVSLRALSDSATTLSDRQRREWGDAAWVTDAQLSWRYGGVDRQTSALTVPVVFEVDGDEAVFLAAGLPQAERQPLWLSGPVRVARNERAMAVTTPRHSATRFLRLADRAARTVARTVPRWRGRLCLEVAGDQASFRDVAGIPQEQAAAVAAVVTTPDGVTLRGAAQHVYVNPKLFDPLSAQGRAIVLAHEAAHVALGAALLDLPLWLAEGMADYIALVDSPLPVEELAAQVLELTRQRGAPRSLPSDARFDGSDRHIGAWYEAAWLAVRLIADTYGEQTLWRFYRASVEDGDTARAFREVLGTSRRDFTREWRSHLAELAA